MKKVYYTVNLGMTRITPGDLLVKARNMVAMMTGNATYATPTPALADVSAASVVLEEAISAYQLNPGPGEVVDRDVAFDALKSLVTDLGGYVQSASNGDITLIKSAGCVVRKSPEPVGMMPKPKNVTAQNSPLRGRIEVRWGGVRGRSVYELEFCLGDPTVEANWKLLALTSKNWYNADGLESDSEYYFRVKAIGAAGAGPLSDSAHAKAA
ncbi:MAG: fibronectin type III domain-containing protein [Flavobacteriales bacterium]|jgi:hypothetical protein|nr:fibronectin type III domain-containing protein [Flavobacteriales bacterium]